MQRLFHVFFIVLFLLSCEDNNADSSSLYYEDFEDNSFTANGWGVQEYDVSFEPWQISSEKSRSGTQSMISAVLSSEQTLSMLYIYRMPTIGVYGDYRVSFYINLECQDSNSDARLSTLLQSANNTPAGETSLTLRSTVMHEQVGSTSDWEKIEFEFNTNAIASPPNMVWVFQGKSGEAHLGSDCRCFIDDFEISRPY
tara:strand:- start:1886 stop:2479 length:594 start_codon:yes stop_codon:yes gene_type:complete